MQQIAVTARLSLLIPVALALAPFPLPLALGRAAAAGAQTVPTPQLSKPEAVMEEPFTQIAGVRELRDGRVIVVDSRDKVVQLVDLKTGSATRIGREGQGPGEYSLPMAVVSLPGDTSAVFDPLNQRYLLITPDGKPGAFLSTRPAGDDEEPRRGSGPGGGMMRMGGPGMNPPRASDRNGYIYVAGSPFRMGPDGPVAQDSVPLQRFDRGKRSYETVAYLKVPKNNAQVSGGGNRMEVRIGGANPFLPRDEWAVAAGGRIAIVHAEDYRVEWVSPNAGGQRTLGPATQYRKIKVTDKHKKWWNDTQRRRGGGMMITNQNGRMTAAAGPPPPPEERSDWPEYLPPFLANAAQVAPNGELWVLQAAAADDVPPTYDVFDAAGKLSARVQLPLRSRLVGFGNGTAYVAKYDEDDLQYLQRYRLR